MSTGTKAGIASHGTVMRNLIEPTEWKEQDRIASPDFNKDGIPAAIKRGLDGARFCSLW